MLYLACAVACSLAIGVLFKLAGRRGLDRPALLTVNYAAAVASAGALLAVGARAPAAGWAASLADPALWALGAGTGVLFIAGFFLLALATQTAGLALAIGVMRVSVVMPVVAAWAIWAEAPSGPQLAGLALGSLAFFLIARPAAPEAGRAAGDARAAEEGAPAAEEGAPAAEVDAQAFGVLALLFVVGGAVDVALKTFDELFARETGRLVLFLLLVYSMAFVVGLAVVVARGVRTGRWPTRRVAGWGALLGVVNYASTDFFLRAVEALPAPFVFPANNIAIVLGGAALGALVWGEHLSRANRLGLVAAAVALLLLGVGR